MTNADRIRAMTDEELAGMFAVIESMCYRRSGHECYVERFIAQWLDWLQQEVQE